MTPDPATQPTPEAQSEGEAGARPTRVRYQVVAMTTMAAFMLYLDRVCMAEIVKDLSFREQVTLNPDQIGGVLGAFFWAYALAQVPAGWLSDRFGARGIMVFYIALWSVFTALSGLAVGFVSLLLARIGCGLAQAGAYPTSGSLLSRWVPFASRGRASSVVAFGGRVGGAAAPLLTVALIGIWGGWRPVLLLYGGAGLGIAWLFWIIFRDRPEEHPRCHRAECELIQRGRPAIASRSPGKPNRIPMAAMLRSPSLWLLCVSSWGTNVGWVFLVTWLPTYLSEARGVEPLTGGKMATTVLLIGMGGMLLGGWVTDVATRHWGTRWGRSLPLAFSRFLAALAYVACLFLDSPWLAVFAFAVVSIGTDLGAPCFWAFLQDVGGRQVGSVFGWANMWGNLGAAATASLLPWVLKTWDDNGDWHEAFYLCAAGYLIAGVAALGINATVPVTEE